MSLQFQKRIEDFNCENCGFFVAGNGYTNHCPQCLWSKHVDVAPGDRLATCGGLMKPISVVMEKGEFILTHQCVKCGHTKRNKANQTDNLDLIFAQIKAEQDAKSRDPKAKQK